MARVIVNSVLLDCIKGPVQESEINVDAADVRMLIKKLDQQFPGLAAKLQSNHAVAIDGEIFADPLLETLEPDSEVFFLPAIEGG